MCLLEVIGGKLCNLLSDDDKATLAYCLLHSLALELEKLLLCIRLRMCSDNATL